MKFKDYYEVFGVERTAAQDEIKRAYRKLARKYHPDVNKEAEAEARFKEVGEAYEVLRDPEKRAAYDRMARGHGGQDFEPPPNWNSGFEFSGGPRCRQSVAITAISSRRCSAVVPGGAGAHRARGHAQGRDHHAKIED